MRQAWPGQDSQALVETAHQHQGPPAWWGSRHCRGGRRLEAAQVEAVGQTRRAGPGSTGIDEQDQRR